MNHIIESLSPIERAIIPYINLPFSQIVRKSGLDAITVTRALSFLEKKKILEIINRLDEIIDLDTNGIYYKKTGLPERKLLNSLSTGNHLSFEEAQKKSSLTDNEFRAALGLLKRKNLVDMHNGKLSLSAKEHLSKKMPEENFLEKLPIEKASLSQEENKILIELLKRKDLVKITEEKEIKIELSELGKSLAGKKIESDMLEEVTPELIKIGVKNKKFRRYDLSSQVPTIYPGKKHFVNQSIDYAKKIWLELGFKELSGPLVETSFWNFDALFTGQDHPAREMQDSFFLKLTGKLPDKKILDRVKLAHESGVDDSKGLNYIWNPEEAKKTVLRTHTTSLSARALANLSLKDLPVKYFAIGKVFRNETIDWSHGIEFYQTEGIVVDENVNFRHLLGYLKQFYEKMGFDKIRFRPSYFPYTEPSVEIEVFHPIKKIWLELGGAGIFRPEVTEPLLGKPTPVLAWGQGFDRIIMDFYKINDLRTMYANDLKDLRQKRMWTR